jgi:hypothetical protein
MTQWHKISFVIGNLLADDHFGCPEEEWANHLTAREIRDKLREGIAMYAPKHTYWPSR